MLCSVSSMFGDHQQKHPNAFMNRLRRQARHVEVGTLSADETTVSVTLHFSVCAATAK